MILYHGTTKVFPALAAFSFLADSMAVAAQYAQRSYYATDKTNRILQVRLKPNLRYLHVSAAEMKQAVREKLGVCGDYEDYDEWLRDRLIETGYDVLVLRDLSDLVPPDWWEHERYKGHYPTQYVVRDETHMTIINELTYNNGEFV